MRAPAQADLLSLPEWCPRLRRLKLLDCYNELDDAPSELLRRLPHCNVSILPLDTIRALLGN